MNIQSWHLEITSRCQLACHKCPRTIFSGHYDVTDLKLADIKNFFHNHTHKVKDIVLCGNHGDPIYHREFHDYLTYCVENKIFVTVITNGSGKSLQWWQKTASIIKNGKGLIIFSVDGLEDTNHIYRKGARWDSIRLAMDTCVKHNARTQWKFIVFRQNQHQLQQAQELADQIGINKFQVVKSNRFDNDDPMKPSPQFLSKRPSYENSHSNKKMRLEPQCIKGEKHYINASGIYFPCCWIANYPKYEETLFNQNNWAQTDIRKNSLSGIMQSSTFKTFIAQLSSLDSASKPCQKFCGKSLHETGSKQWTSTTVETQLIQLNQ